MESVLLKIFKVQKKKKKKKAEVAEHSRTWQLQPLLCCILYCEFFSV